ncbi:MAG: SDR family oxidoreductase [Betaproteobacteria bacterium]|nr:SDR family oxidoreductase [Betaproteobacteria bacterium]MDC3408501.1 SDR family oxidoreductase [Burkholderiales bacterium]MBT5671718.1 SDR family oxidoreductase [Betaproteobacteria bacterium]MBT6183734.1 SDR family oxidoreductase [Betaproteobacteria bacterium]MBT6529519.1 SDR family oxidoreductase [Betaproteobacteria bacterium]
MRLKNKVALITGGGGGIGRATAERFVEEGAKVVIAEIDPKVGRSAAESARTFAGENGGDACFIYTDVSDEKSVRNVIDQTVQKYGKLNILHNNAGGSTLDDGPVTTAPIEEFWRCIKLDLFGTFLCSKFGIPEIIRAGGGSVINMTSNVALMALPGRDCYTAAKGGVASMTRSMAAEYASEKIRVNAIAPSTTLSDRVKKLLEASPEIKAVSETHLLGLGLPIHIAEMAVYLASDESAITTGQVLPVDSGVTIV